jgi:RNA polymerase sigma-70 factor (ECF subfamily)
MAAVRVEDLERGEARETGAEGTGGKTEVQALVERAASGSFGAFGEIYNIFLDRIYRYVFYQVKDRMTAEDLTEEIFLKVWEAMGKYKQKNSSFSAWLYRIAHNHVVDYFRTRRQHVALEDVTTSAPDNPEHEAEEKAMQQELAEVISSLPPRQKQVIILKFIEGLDNGEIARITGKREGAIRMLQMRALMALRQKLTGPDSAYDLNYLKPLAKVYDG